MADHFASGSVAKSIPTLKVVDERKLHELLPMCGKDSRLEASGVVQTGDNYIVVCDNIGQVARINCDFEHTERNGFFGEPVGYGFEGITFSGGDGRFFLLIEALPTESGEFKAKVVEWDREFRLLVEQWLDFTFEDENRGFEGLAVVDRDEARFLLALCEGNMCRSGKKGRRPGGGRIQVFQPGDDEWRHFGTIELPMTVEFEDYAGLALDGSRIAIVSQASSGLWIGSLDSSSWTIDGDGQVYDFPRSSKGKTVYGNAEGVCWIAEDRIVIVSDRRKSDQPKRCGEKDQSIHVFEIPKA